VPRPELPHCGVVGDYSRENPRLTFAEGGRLLKLSFARSPAREWNDELFFKERGVRGKCKGFSFGSRRRMLDRLNMVSVASRLPYFVTATLPDDVFNDDAGEFAKTAKVWMDNFTKRLLRVCPSACGFWRVEWQSRKSGLYEGKLFPHFHLLVWGLPERVVSSGFVSLDPVFEAFVDCPDNQLQWEFVKTFGTAPERPEWRLRCETTHNGQKLVFAGSNRFVARCRSALDVLSLAQASPLFEDRARQMAFQDWASLAWYHVVDSHNVDHLSAGLRVERVKSWGGVMSYCAKYMAKTDSGFLSDVQFGRSWGIFNRAAVPWAKLVEIDLDADVGNRLRRIARRYMENRRGRAVRAPYGLTLYCDTANWKRLWRPDPPPDPF